MPQPSRSLRALENLCDYLRPCSGKSAMKILTGVPAERLNDIPSLAQAAEHNGFSGLSTQENRHNPFLPLAIAAVHSQQLDLRLDFGNMSKQSKRFGIAGGMALLFNMRVSTISSV